MPDPLRVGSYNLPTRSPLYLHGTPLDAISDHRDLATDLSPGQRTNSANRFWATPARPMTSTIREVMEIGLTTDHWINSVSLSLARFPCKVWLQYYDGETQQWMPILLANTQAPLLFGVHQSIPSRIPAGVVEAAHHHPHHFGPGHWQHHDDRIVSVLTKRVRAILVRTPSSNAPVDRLGKLVDYSLAIKDLDLGFVADSPEALPEASIPTQNVDEVESFASSVDLLGSPVSYGFRQHRAMDLVTSAEEEMSGIGKANRVTDKAVWKSEPQPFSYAVVNLHVDARDAEGEPQSIDRFFVNPTTPGVHCNLYYSNDDPDPRDFEASQQPLRYPMVKATGDVTVTQTHPLFGGGSGYLDISNVVVHWPWRRDWWFGLTIQPQFDSTSGQSHVFLDSAHLRIEWISQALVVTAYSGSTSTTEVVFTSNSEVSIVVIKRDNQVFVQCQNWHTTIAVDDTIPSPFVAPFRDQIRVGGYLATDTGSAAMRLLSLVLKRERVVDLDTLALAYVARPDSYVRKPGPRSARADLTDNALLRQHGSFATKGPQSSNRYGFLGGTGNHYDDIVWTPVCRDYRLKRGYMQFDPVLAKYFKFEFTSLSPQAYQTPVPVSRRVKLFTDEIVTQSSPLATSVDHALGGSGTVVNSVLGDQVQYSDMLRLVTKVYPDRSYDDYSPVEALYSTDPTIAERMAERHLLYSFEPWRKQFAPPRFSAVSRHHYQTVDFRQKTKTAYFVGLKSLRMFKVDYTAPHDTGAYLDLFHDSALIDSSVDDTTAWVVTPNLGLAIPSPLNTTYAETTSKVLNSERNLLGVQFATVQSQPQQLLADPDFDDASLTYWNPYQDALIESSDEVLSNIGTTVKVSRQRSGLTWDFMQSDYPTWDSTADQTWDSLGGDVVSLPLGGIQSKLFITPARGGRLYAAARVYADKPLLAPLHLQIISADDGVVLSDEPFDIATSQISEWYNTYTIGEVAGLSGLSWNAVEAAHPTWDSAEATGTWNLLDTSAQVFAGPVTVRLVQSGITEDVWFVDNLSLYQDPIVWEFSNNDGIDWWPVYGIRNNPHGVFLFPDTDAETLDSNLGTNLRWRVKGYTEGLVINALQIRPWYLTLAQGVPYREITENTGPNVTTYDQYAKITDAPMFKAWSEPVPQEWTFAYRQWLQLQANQLPFVQPPGSDSCYPAATLYPSDDLYPCVDSDNPSLLVTQVDPTDPAVLLVTGYSGAYVDPVDPEALDIVLVPNAVVDPVDSAVLDIT